MLFCDTCGTETRDLEDLAVFASQLSAAGIRARIQFASIPTDLGRNLQFDLARYLTDRLPGPGDHVVLLASHRLTDAKLVALRRLSGDATRCTAFGTYPTRQAAIGLRAKLSYVFGSEPELHDLTNDGWSGGAGSRGPVFGMPRRGKVPARPRLLLVEPDLADPREAAGVVALALSQRLQVTILTNGRAKRGWQTTNGTEVPVFHYGEVLPVDLAERVDICATFTPLLGNYRLQCLVANLGRSGVPLLDATPGHAIASDLELFVRAPVDTVTLAPFLEAEILPNRAEIGRRTAGSRTAACFAPEVALPDLGTPAPDAPADPIAPLAFVPTNGIGLGHAQRCALVAGEIASDTKPVFAAFPSCTRLVKSYGFDVMPMISRSDAHRQSFENDLVNYVRLRALTAGGRSLVFDGGYVFDSIYRTILENRLRGIWIRRGLWQPAQDNSVALDREKVFARVIVPLEAFAELNTRYSHGDHVREVGPVVRRTTLSARERDTLRASLAARYGLDFDHLVVSLLGGGIAADRSAQIQALCGMTEPRSDVLHLVVLWPGARQEPGWFGWRRTRVVRTDRAGILLAAADLCVAAAGYNLFHEVLYNRTPAIFLPQTGAFMDDQNARARAASERGLASVVEPNELMRLERELNRFLSRGEAEATAARLARIDLPEPGNRAAARAIEEVHDDDHGLLDDTGARHAAPRR
ncbi:glycosyltransferase [uncultured Jannaschia sp.]|uniref:glycosyltransferase n=1 Tax=uncultured Jannaschia sp. TaxID=293347 RepID=UPI002631F7C2|nr:glycosyltransferase [uncultured Jannaschia sp.]